MWWQWTVGAVGHQDGLEMLGPGSAAAALRLEAQPQRQRRPRRGCWLEASPGSFFCSGVSALGRESDWDVIVLNLNQAASEIEPLGFH